MEESQETADTSESESVVVIPDQRLQGRGRNEFFSLGIHTQAELDRIQNLPLHVRRSNVRRIRSKRMLKKGELSLLYMRELAHNWLVKNQVGLTIEEYLKDVGFKGS